MFLLLTNFRILVETFVSRSSPIYASLLLFDQETQLGKGEKVVEDEETLFDHRPSSSSSDAVSSADDQDQDRPSHDKTLLQDQIDNLCIKLL